MGGKWKLPVCPTSHSPGDSLFFQRSPGACGFQRGLCYMASEIRSWGVSGWRACWRRMSSCSGQSSASQRGDQCYSRTVKPTTWKLPRTSLVGVCCPRVMAAATGTLTQEEWSPDGLPGFFRFQFCSTSCFPLHSKEFHFPIAFAVVNLTFCQTPPTCSNSTARYSALPPIDPSPAQHLPRA